MTNLTEQWKKGELPLGHYYVVCSKNDTVEILQNRVQIVSCNKVGITYDFPDYWEVKQVLAEVPSYELWKAVHEQWEVLLEENTKLKELLKDAKNVLKMVDTYCGDYDSINGFLIVEKINQVLGEE